jgi:2-iminobutanoate/2-iminopropanoate deaminase
MSMTRIGASPERPYSLAIAAEGKFIFVSGQIPMRDGRMVSGPIGEQTAAVLQNISDILTSAGAALSDVVRCGVFLADLDDLAEFNVAYVAAFGSTLPARSTVGVALPGYGVEIDCIAVIP